MVLKPPEIRANVFVVLGEHDTSDDNDEEVEILVTRVINHPNYNSPDFGKNNITSINNRFVETKIMI